MKSKSLFKDGTYWNRKLHIHIGLFLFLFIWLFSLSGLLLNHGNWKFSRFWENRKEREFVTAINIPAGIDSVRTLKSVLSQLKISGEVTHVKMMMPDSIDFDISYPGNIKKLHIDLKRRICIQKEIKFNFWGKLRTLHTFNGANKENTDLQPNWLITRVWRFSMDAIAVGLIFLSFSSWIMWYKIRRNYSWGLLALILGFVFAVYFIFLLRLI